MVRRKTIGVDKPFVLRRTLTLAGGTNDEVGSRWQHNALGRTEVDLQLKLPLPFAGLEPVAGLAIHRALFQPKAPIHGLDKAFFEWTLHQAIGRTDLRQTLDRNQAIGSLKDLLQQVGGSFTGYLRHITAVAISQ